MEQADGARRSRVMQDVRRRSMSGRAMLRDPACVGDISRSTACRPAERVPGERAGLMGVRADVRARKEYPHRFRRPTTPVVGGSVRGPGALVVARQRLVGAL